MDVKASFIMRDDLRYSDTPATGFVGMSSMFWKGENDTQAINNDEAHDADVLKITYSDGSADEYPLYSHFSDNPVVDNYPSLNGKKIVSFALEQRDRNVSHYSAYESASYHTRISFAVDNIESSIPFQVTRHVFPTNSEYHDNIVVHMTILSDLSKGQEITLSYSVRAY